MKILTAALAALALVAGPAAAQAPAFKPSAATSDNNPQPVKLHCWNAGLGKYAPCTFTAGGGGSGTSDTTAANQASQIALETAIRDRIGATSSPAPGTVTQLLGEIGAALGAPLQAGGSIGNTAFGATQSGVWDLRNVTGTVSLPTGAAIATKQDSQIALETAIRDQIGATSAPATGTVTQRLGAIEARLGSPFQAGGSIGNTAFGATQSGTWNLANITGTVSLPTGAATATNQATLNGYVDGLEAAVGTPGDVAWSGSGAASQTAILKSVDASLRTMATGSQDSTPIAVTNSSLGAPTDTAATTTDGTATSLVAQAKQAVVKLNQLLAVLPASLGPKPNASSLSIVAPKAASGTITRIAVATTSTQLLAANPARLGCYIVHESSASGYLAMAASASSTSYTGPTSNGSGFTCPANYTGPIAAIAASATGSDQVTEW